MGEGARVRVAEEGGVSRMSRNKGKRGELELAKLLRKHGFNAQRTPYSGAGTVKGDLVAHDMAAAIPGFHIECKRVERLNLPEAIRQAWAQCGVNIPVLFHRRNDTRTGDPVAKWHVTLPAEDWLADQAELRQLRRERAA